MTYVEELKKLKTEAPNPLYWFAISCPYLERELIEAIGNKLGGLIQAQTQLDLSDTPIQDFSILLGSGSIFSSGKLIIVEGAAKIKGDAGKDIIEAIKQANPANIILFKDYDIQKTTSLGKYLALNAVVIEETGLDDKILASWIKKRFKDQGCEVTDEAVRMLLERSIGDMVALAMQIEMLSNFVGNAKKITQKEVAEIVPENPEIVIFQVLDALSARQPAKGIRFLHELIGSGEPPERVLVMVYNHFLRVLEAQSLGSKATEKQVAEALRCHPFVAKKALQSSKAFSKEELIGYLTYIQEADVAVKTGLAEPLFAIETALFQLVTKY